MSTLGQLVKDFRVDSDDRPRDLNGKKDDLLWPDEDVKRWLGEAEEEAAIRKRLLYDDYTLAMVRIDVTAGVSSYPLDPRMFEVSKARLLNATTGRHVEDLFITTREQLDLECLGWRDERRQPELFIQDDTRIVLPGIVDKAYTLRIEGYRTPLKPMEACSADSVKPEIAVLHHRYLVKWALYRAYSKQDADTLDPARADRALGDFEAYFGKRPMADMHRRMQANQPHHTRSYF
jgi:hypothetical protein